MYTYLTSFHYLAYVHLWYTWVVACTQYHFIYGAWKECLYILMGIRLPSPPVSILFSQVVCLLSVLWFAIITDLTFLTPLSHHIKVSCCYHYSFIVLVCFMKCSACLYVYIFVTFLLTLCKISQGHYLINIPRSPFPMPEIYRPHASCDSICSFSEFCLKVSSNC